MIARGGGAQTRGISPLFRFDLQAAEQAGVDPVVAGADEAGRGALAGPLVVAAVCFDYREWARDDFIALAALTDSKRLSARRRADLVVEILPRARLVTVVVCAARSIDERGLHRCNLESLQVALEALAPPPAVAHVDGFVLSACRVAHRGVVGGDGLSAAVAAASIVAKVTRDGLMHRLHEQYPAWGFDEHVGYATPGHQQAIIRHGVCAQHRRSFASVAYSQLALLEEQGR